MEGYHIGLSSNGIRSLMNCIPSSIALNIPNAIPNAISNVEHHGISVTDHVENLLLKPPSKQSKDIYKIANIIITFPRHTNVKFPPW